MRDNEYDENFELLKNTLKRIELNLVVEQVENEIRMGELSEEKPAHKDNESTFNFNGDNTKVKSKMSYIKEYS